MGIVSERRLQAATYQDLHALQRKLSDVMSVKRNQEKPTLAEKLSRMAAEYDLSLADLVGHSRKSARRVKRAKAPSTEKAAAPTPSNGVTAAPEKTEQKPIKAKRGKRRASQSAPIKYRNKETGETWSGRGKMVGWLAQQLKSGHKLAEFRV